uniref:DUF6884 domain-containing protein n=1 Tax=Desulfacinum infernum TaxID=35837 RepID=A0A831ZY59_9BACT
MATIVLISCVSKKMSHRARAKDLYVSPLFRAALQYAQRLSPDKIFILSAKYGLVQLNDEIDPYDVTLKDMPVGERKNWASKVLQALDRYCDLERDHFVILAGKRYREYLLPYLKSYEMPLEGLSIGRQLQYLKQMG